MTIQEKINPLSLPETTRRHLASACDALVNAGGADLAALVLYGSAATGRYVPGTSDINLLIILKRATPELLRAMGPHLRQAFRSARLEPLLLTESELSGGADVFPTKFKDIASAHVVLHGDAKLSALTFSREHLRLRVEQELRNLSLRFRRRYAVHAGSSDDLREDITATVAAFASELRHLLDLSGTTLPHGAALAEVFAAASSQLGLPRAALDACAAFHDRPAEKGSSAEDAAVGLLEALSRAAELANALPESK